MELQRLLTDALQRGGGGEARGAAALRVRTRFQPAAGAGTRVMPPTYSSRVPRDDRPVYLVEERRIEDALVPSVLLDGQASQSNRLEEALISLLEVGDLRIPDVVIDQAEFGRHSALELSHRVFDAFAEDALLGGVRFGDTQEFERLASVINRGVAKPMVERFPVGLLLGCWASRRHNPQGSTRLARAVTSEIIGYGMLPGERASSKIDLHHIARDVQLTDAASDSSGSARFEVVEESKTKSGERPSKYGYGNVTPQAASHGGVTIRFAEQQTVISLAALRAVRTGELGVATTSVPDTDLAARELLAFLALAMLEAQAEFGWDLRSGCHLVPESEPTVELVGRVGEIVASERLIGLGAIEALQAAIPAAKGRGVDWDVDPLELVASPQQLALLRRSLGRPAEEVSQG